MTIVLTIVNHYFDNKKPKEVSPWVSIVAKKLGGNFFCGDHKLISRVPKCKRKKPKFKKKPIS